MVDLGTDTLLPTMLVVFSFGIVFRLLVYYHLRREEIFAEEFEKRTDSFLKLSDATSKLSFFGTVKKLLLITYYEMFEKRALLQRRKIDPVMAISDRVFLTKQGFALLVKDVLLSLRFFKYDNNEPKLMNVSKNAFEKNPCFTRVLGIIPSGVVNDVLNILPGMFIVGGIFGTFLGIMKALPDLGGMDLKDMDRTKDVMDMFLLNITFSMSTSLVGIVLSVVMSIVNAVYSPAKVFMRTVERFEYSLMNIWNRCSDNVIHPGDLEFNEHQNPLEALAEQALNQEHVRANKRWYNDQRVKSDDKKAS
jgi:hypothetical protein